MSFHLYEKPPPETSALKIVLMGAASLVVGAASWLFFLWLGLWILRFLEFIP